MNSGQISATVSDALIDGQAIDQNRVDHWNETITSQLLILGKKTPNRSPQSVKVTLQAVVLTWILSS